MVSEGPTLLPSSGFAFYGLKILCFQMVEVEGERRNISAEKSDQKRHTLFPFTYFFLKKDFVCLFLDRGREVEREGGKH